MPADQLGLFDLPEAQLVTGAPWIKQCGDTGPFCVAAPTPKAPGRRQIVTCTRPAHQTGDHCFAVTGRGVIAAWDRTGRPTYPQLISERTINGSANPL